MDRKPNGKSRTKDKSCYDVLLTQPVIRHPIDNDVHNPSFDQYFQYMRVLAEQMGFFSLVTSGVPTPPAHLLSLASYLREQNISVSVADLNLIYLSEGSDPEKELIKRLERDKPKILGLSAMESFLLDSVYRLAEAAKKCDPQLFIVLGGVNATAMDEEILQTKRVDAVVRGEGEATFAELCQVLLNQESFSKVRGISYIEGDKDELLKLVHYFLCIPWPGTEIGGHPEKYGLKIVCRNHRNFITAPSVPIASTKYLSAEEVYSLWEEGVVGLCDEVKKKLLFMELQKMLDI